VGAEHADDQPDTSDAGSQELSLAENPQLRHAVRGLPPERQAAIYQVMQQEMSHSGWLPTPDFMREYEAVLPGLAERIVALPEREQAFRHLSMKDVVKRDYRLRTTGQWMAMVALVLILAFCVFLVVSGEATAAAWVAGTVIVGTVGVFVTGQLSGNLGSSSSKDEVE
jgi:uncharacterized membrane protein